MTIRTVLPRWALALAAMILFATGADAFVIGRLAGSVGAATPAALTVYPGCLAAPTSLTAPYASSKTWYVSGTDVTPAGDTPDNGADGTAAHPYNSLTALFVGNGNSLWTGYSAGARAVFGPYFQSGLQQVRNAAQGTLTLSPTIASTLGGVPIWRRNSDGALYSGAQH